MKLFCRWEGLVPVMMLAAFVSGPGAPLSAAPAAPVYTADVVIVGAGGAGMSAAIEARRAGATVIVLEKSSTVGGNTLATMSGINAAETDVQKAAGVTFTKAQFVQMQTNPSAVPALTQALAEFSAPAIAWLESIGMKFSVDPKSDPFSHHSTDGRNTGVALVDALSQALDKSGAAVLYNTTATSLVVEKGRVVGVVAQAADGTEETFRAPSVVLATGGYGQNSQLVSANQPRLAGAITDEIAPTTGDGLVMARAIGARAVDLDKMTTFPTVEVKTHQMIFPMDIPGDMIFVDAQGQRFVAEAFDDPQTVAAVLRNGATWGVFDQKHLDDAAGLQELNKYGVLVKASTIEELARALKVDVAHLRATVARWNADVPRGKDGVFGRTNGLGHGINQAPYYAVSFGVGVHYCLGGLLINADTQVLDVKSHVIPGLYAAGEVTGGVHGTTKVDGSAVADTVIFGRRAGQLAAAASLKTGSTPLVVPETKKKALVKAQGHFQDGSYQGQGAGHNGDLQVQVVVKDGNIVDIKILKMDETPTKVKAIESTLIPAIVDTQSLDVDAVSGATLSSDAVLNAVADALGLPQKAY